MTLTCTQSKQQYSNDLPIWKSETGALLDLEHEASFPVDLISKRLPSLWRYREAIPLVSDEHLVTMQEGFTPLINLRLKGRTIGIKQEQLFSTGSYKDRGATVLMSHAKSIGISEVVQDSSGNAGCSIAAYAAMAGIRCTIYLQADTAPAKIAQMSSYGATIRYINGSREDVAEAVLTAAASVYYASHSWNPFFFHGTKTFAYEICEQLGWKAPDSVVVPAGNGTLVIGCYLGFTDLLKAGIIDKMPKLIAVQAENCAPLAAAFSSGAITYGPVTTSPTLAEGIAIARPVRGEQILKYVRESNGCFITVNETEIKDAFLECACKGFYIEPTSAATMAGVLRYMENHPDEEIISLFSGHGLKSTDKIMKLI
jgi:threonine synthase